MSLGNVSISIAFSAGFLSFFTPCILPMVPVYIMYMTGTTAESEVSQRKMRAFTRTIGFVIGFTIVFIIMGTSASILGKFFARNKQIFSKISGALIIIFGLNMMGVLKLKFPSIKGNVTTKQDFGSGWFSSILMGMAFAAGWTPCFGPVLGSILLMAGGADNISQGVFLLLVYSLGMAVPFILTSLFINVFNKFLGKAGKLITYLPKIGGAIMVVFGLLVFFNKVMDISILLQ